MGYQVSIHEPPAQGAGTIAVVTCPGSGHRIVPTPFACRCTRPVSQTTAVWMSRRSLRLGDLVSTDDRLMRPRILAAVWVDCDEPDCARSSVWVLDYGRCDDALRGVSMAKFTVTV